jgi:hypothetical protein
MHPLVGGEVLVSTKCSMMARMIEMASTTGAMM